MTDIMPAYSSPAGLKELQPVPPFLSASCDVVKVRLGLLLLQRACVQRGGNNCIEAIIMS